MPTLPVYATADELAASVWAITPVPADVNTRLRLASLKVWQAVRLAFYAADPATSLPTDTDLRNTFRDATLAQVAFWTAAGINPAAGAVQKGGPLTSRAMGSASMSYAAAAASGSAFTAGAEQLCDEAAEILRSAHHLNLTRPIVIG